MNMRKSKAIGTRFIDLPWNERKRIVELVFREAELMRNQKGDINYHELSRITFAKTNVHVWPSTIRSWLNGEVTPMKAGRLKAPRKPPDEDAQIVRGLIATDLHRHDTYHTIWLSLNTTKDFYAYSLRRFLAKYGWVTVKPVLIPHTPEWRMSAYLGYELWIHELQRPIDELNYKEKMKFLSGVISGDGWITITHTNRERVSFSIAVSSSRKHKAELFHQLLNSMSIPHSVIKRRRKGKLAMIEGVTVRTKAYYEYCIVISAKSGVREILNSVNLLQPFREVKRILALRFIQEDELNYNIVKPVWDYVKILEKASTIRSKLRVCCEIPVEVFKRRGLDKEAIINQLKTRLEKYYAMLSTLKSKILKNV